MNLSSDTIALQVLGYVEDDKWVAVALEMDLRGYGDSFDEAVEDLRDSVLMQLSFAAHMGAPEMIFKPAEKKYLDAYKQARTAAFQALIAGQKKTDTSKQVGDIHVPDNWRDTIAGSFEPAYATA